MIYPFFYDHTTEMFTIFSKKRDFIANMELGKKTDVNSAVLRNPTESDSAIMAAFTELFRRRIVGEESVSGFVLIVNGESRVTIYRRKNQIIKYVASLIDRTNPLAAIKAIRTVVPSMSLKDAKIVFDNGYHHFKAPASLKMESASEYWSITHEN